MKHIGILRWNVLSRLCENRRTEPQSYVCCNFLCKAKIAAVSCYFSARDQELPCAYFIFQGERCMHSWEIVALQIMLLMSYRVPMLILKYKLSFPFVTFPPYLMLLSCPQHCHLFAFLWCSLEILALASTALTQPADPCWVWQGKRDTCTEPSSAWSIFQPCQFFLGSRDKGNVLG